MPKAIRIPINYVGVFVFSMHVLTKYRKHGTALILRMLHNVCTLHALLVVTMVISPEVKALIRSIAAGRQTRSLWRIAGLIGGVALPPIAIAFSLVTYPLFSLYSNYKERFITVKLFLILFAVVYMGRTGSI